MDTQYVVVREDQAEYITDLDAFPVIEPISSIFEKGFTRVPDNFIAHLSEMPQGTISIYLFLLSCINGKYLADTGIALAWPGYPTIADATGIRSHDTIQHIIAKLIKLGFVSKEKGYPPIKSNEGTIFAPSKKDIQKCWLYTLKSGLEGKEFSHAEMDTYLEQKKYNRTIPGTIATKTQK